MGRKASSKKVKIESESFEQLKITEPNPTLIHLYDQRNHLLPEDLVSRLHKLALNRSPDAWRLHPINAETIWYILGYLCDVIYNDEELKSMAKIIENRKLYNQFDTCRSHILDLNIDHAEKKIRLELILTALCKTTTIYLTVANNATKFIRPNFFLDLLNGTRDPSVQSLQIKSRILQRIEYIHCMVTNNNVNEDNDEKVTKTPNRQEIAKLFTAVPPDDITVWNTVPTHRDIFWSEAIFLRPNFVRRSYPDLETYKDVQFRLLMEDFMRPLRLGIQKLNNGEFGPKGIPELRIYENVTLKFLQSQRLVPERQKSWRFYSAKFKTLDRVNWSTSRRLIHGSLVCLWDGSNELIIATVAYSQPEDLVRGQVVLVVETEFLPINFTKKVYVMLESVVFFEPYRAVLQVLQNFSYETFPMLDYFLGLEKNQLPPIYIENATSYTLRDVGNELMSLTNLKNRTLWPSAEKLGLDDKQHAALQAALTSRVSLIQGPPGTGKTFLALRILRSLLDNKSLWYGKWVGSQELAQQIQTKNGSWYEKNRQFWKRPANKMADQRTPVVVICFTNHALDQFLEGILSSTKNIVRIGGQSKSSVLDEFNINEIKRSAMAQQNSGPYFHSNYFHFFHRMKSVRVDMDVLASLIQSKIRYAQSIEVVEITELERKGVISREIYQIFVDAEKRQNNACKKRQRGNNILKWWLGWSNHRQLFKILREMRLTDLQKGRVSQMANVIKDDKEDELPENFETLDGRDDDIIEEDMIDVDDDYREEVRLALKQVGVVGAPVEPTDEEEDKMKGDDMLNDGEKNLVDFAKTQLQRMQTIRDLLLGMIPDPSLLEGVPADQILDLPLKQRWMLFAHWKRIFEDMVNQDLIDTKSNYEAKIEEYSQLKGEALAALCRTADVVGMTTTGAAKNRLMLESLKAKIVIVEEAAEVLESHIVCSLTAECQQLIMIGDHQQLRPSVNVHELAKNYQLDVSLFERLVLGDMKPFKLGVQHRMRAEVARLIVPAIYPHLENHASIYNHPHVPGIQHDVFFYHHTNPEKEEGSSFYNLHEVVMAMNLALYLIRDHGIQPNRITILATYTAQLHQFLNKRKQYQFHQLAHVRMTVVDNFQGEENDVIILSLVRNNNRNSVGFLRIENRVCVALSRARNGLFILGNMRMLANASPLWAQMEQVLLEYGEIGEEFPLRCDEHHQTVRKVKKVEDFPNGSFCNAPCGAQLNCGHVCQRVCHKQGAHNPCMEKVSKELPCGHHQLVPCTARVTGIQCLYPMTMTVSPCDHVIQVACWQYSIQDIKCHFPVNKTLPCGHSQELRCCDPLLQSLCRTPVEIELICSHVTTAACGISILTRYELNVSCNQRIRKTLPCGHVKEMACRADPTDMICQRSEELVLKCGHVVKYTCTGNPIDKSSFVCQIKVDRRLPCGHVHKCICSSTKTLICHLEVERMGQCGHPIKTTCSYSSALICNAEVGKMLSCGHLASVLCSQSIDTAVCTSLVEVILPRCSHIQPVPCPISRSEDSLLLWKCEAVPLKTLNCGHEMRLPCPTNVDDEAVKCLTHVNYTLPCDHEVIIPCHSIEEKIQEKCKLPCGTFLNCDHFCSLPCHDNSTSHYCSRLVKKKLICGHDQEIPCYRDVAKEKCFSPISLQRDCGHIINTTCGDRETQFLTICNEQTEKRLPCGHSVEMKCSEPIDNVVCDKPDQQVLRCRHSVPTLCGVPIQKRLLLTCNIYETKHLECGHTYRLKCGSNEADKPLSSLYCRVPVEKKITQCGHTVKVECGKKLSKKDCTSLCEKKLNCGHRCRLSCGEPCQTKSCQEEVELEGVELACGHLLRAECRLRYTDRDVIDKKKLEMGLKCHSRCMAKLACGHRCSSKCHECLTNQFHSICSRPCKKILICGHPCKSKCGQVCPPCNETCNYQCLHKKCRERCGDECSTYCRKPCEWKCPHAQCNHPCDEFCNREPCNYHCPKILKCGHQCNGLCGEICPPKCRTCSGVLAPKSNRKSRYVYLVCGHWIEVEEMDNWMKMDQEEYQEPIRQIQCPSCPICQQPIRQNYRYGDQIKGFYLDLTAVKFNFSDDRFASSEIIRPIINKLRTNIPAVDYGVSVETIKRQGNSISSLNRDLRWDLLYRAQLTFLLSCIVDDSKKGYPVAIGKHKGKTEVFLDGKSLDLLMNKVSLTLQFMNNNPNCGQGLYVELFNIVKRYDLYRQYLAIIAISNVFPDSIRIDQRQLDKADSILTGIRWNEEDEKYLVDWLGRKCSFYKVNLLGSVAKKLKLYRRLTMNGDHWFKCTRASCEFIFSVWRFEQCPECLEY